METFGVNFDAVAAVAEIELRNSLRDNYIPSFEKLLAQAGATLKKYVAKREALESMRSNLDTLCASIRYVCQKMEDPIPAVDETIFDILLYAEEPNEKARQVRENILKEGGELLSPACGAAGNLKILFDDAVAHIQDRVAFWTPRVNEFETALEFWRRSMEMLTWRTIFDHCDNKFKVKISRDAVREYTAYIELAQSFLRWAAKSPLESMHDEAMEDSGRVLLEMAQRNCKYLRSFKNVALVHGAEVALNADETARAESRRRISTPLCERTLYGENKEVCH